MTASRSRYTRPAALTLCNLVLLLASGTVQAACHWGAGSATYMTFQRDMGTFWVPRNAPVGTLIGKSDLRATNGQGAVLNCFYSASDPVTANLPNTPPLFGGSLPPVGGKPVDGRVLQTNIPGVGVFIDLAYPYNGQATNTFTPDNGTAIPYTGVMTQNTAINMPLRTIYGEVMFIKIGDIEAGPHQVQGEVFQGYIHTLGKVFDYTMTATINRAQCTLQGNPVSADPVQLGDYKVEDFKQVGTTTPDTAFHITLSNCEDDSDPSAIRATVHVHLDGAQGSTVIDPAQGLFSLDSNSTAGGLGIQILRSDGSPMPLQTDERVKTLELGTTQLDFRARFYQTDAQV
ncbi:MAG TPA: fimbrial protein, partial [Pseudomonas sp.]|uniref:fimbrial protein n=1 Tax=Pseudomonas sp. TaxID=306 RepID=UPI002B4A4C5C